MTRQGLRTELRELRKLIQAAGDASRPTLWDFLIAHQDERAALVPFLPEQHRAAAESLINPPAGSVDYCDSRISAMTAQALQLEQAPEQHAPEPTTPKRFIIKHSVQE